MPSFFFSYSSADEGNSSGFMKEFLSHLCSALRTVHGKVEEPFFAPQVIEPGEKWRRALAGGLNSSQVLVCLQSASYFESDYCGRELEVFLRRRKLYTRRRVGNPPDCVIPILWYRLPREMPKAVPKDFQGKKPTDNRLPVNEDGLYAAIVDDTSTPNRTSLRYALRIAGRISNLLERNKGDRALPSLPSDPVLDGTPSAFANPEWPPPDLELEQGTGPESVTFVYPTDIDPECPPFAPPQPNALISGAAYAKSSEWIFQGIGYRVADIRDQQHASWNRVRKARDWNSPMVVMLTDMIAKTVAADQFFHDLLFGKGTVTIVFSPTGEAPVDFPEKLRAKTSFTNREQFDDVLTVKLARLRQALMDDATVGIPRTTAYSVLP